MLKIITNADDLGKSIEINNEIFRLMSLGKITSSTILATGHSFEDAAMRSKDFPNASFGIHLNLTEYKPLTSSPLWEKHNLINESGEFNGQIRSVKLSRELYPVIFKEWSAQIDMLKSCGIPVSHIDSHHHVHTIPWLFMTLKAVQKKYNIKKVRKSMNLFYDAQSLQTYRHHANKWLWNRALASYYKSIITDYFTTFYIFQQVTSSSNKTFYGSIELMLHPGALSHIDENRLVSSNWDDFITFPYSKISYNEL